MTVGVVETNDGGSARVCQDLAPIAVELGYSTDTPDADARSPWTRWPGMAAVLSRPTRSGLLDFWVLSWFGVFVQNEHE